MHQTAEHRMGMALVTAAAVAWSLAGFFTRLIPLDAWTILFWRGIFGGFFIALYVVGHYRGRTLAVTRAMGWPGLLITCLSTLGMTTFIPALKLTSVANVAIICATAPFVAAVIAWLWLRERASPLTLGASLLAFAGVALTVAGAGGGANSLSGDILAFVMTSAIAAMTVALRRYREVPMLPTACLSNFLGSLVSLAFAAPLSVGQQDLVHLALFGFVQMSLGLTFFTIGSRLIPAAETALISVLETPLAPLWVWLAFDERVSPRALIGGGVVMVAVIGHVLLQGRLRRPLGPPLASGG
ncbi:MAG TPA: DMT family transporter [Dongiaceae bacterium]|nr:DMT family transporter [Dongiaceae bacterium]